MIRVDSSIVELTRLIPGYDPWETAEDCWFDEEMAQLALDFFPSCLNFVEDCFTGCAGKPFTLEDWQAAIIANLFGWKRPNGYRRYQSVFKFIGRKNGKTPLAAGIALFTLVCDGEIGAQNYFAASSANQAAKAKRHAAGMVRKEPMLASRCRMLKNLIEYEELNSFLQVISSDADTTHGGNAHFVAIDEVHAHKKRDFIDVLTTSTASRGQPIIYYTTTAGVDRLSICFELYTYACQVRDGIIADKSFLPVIYEVPQDERIDWTDPEVWRLANPNLGVSVNPEYLERECKKAQSMPSLENTFRRLHLNQWTQQVNRWIKMNIWNEQAGEIDEEALKGKLCYAGLDLSSVSDLTAFVMVFPREDAIDDDGNLVKVDDVDILCRFWCPEARLHDETNRYYRQYQVWEKQGFLTTTPGDAIDYAFVKAQVLEDAEKFDLQELNVDRLFQGGQLTQELTEDLASKVEVFAMGQGHYGMAAPMREFERRFLKRRLHHGNNPVLNWMANNVAVKTDPAGNVKPDKAESQGKIDGIVALVMGLDRVMRHKDNRSVYEKSDILVLG